MCGIKSNNSTDYKKLIYIKSCIYFVPLSETGTYWDRGVVGVGWGGWGGGGGHGYKAHLIHVNFSLIFGRLGNFSFTLVKVLRLSYGCQL